MGLFGRKKDKNMDQTVRDLFGAKSGGKETCFVFYGKLAGRQHGREDAMLMSFPPRQFVPDKYSKMEMVRVAFGEWTHTDYDVYVLRALGRVGYTDELDDEYDTEESKKDRIRLCQEMEKAVKNKLGVPLSKKTLFYVKEGLGMYEDLFVVTFCVKS